jgi:subtilisin-like proprotein convertase family protein
MEDTIRIILLDLGHPFRGDLKVKLTKFGYFKLTQGEQKGKAELSFNEVYLKWSFETHKGNIKLPPSN